MDKEWFVYILKCADDTLYTGITNHLSRRLRQHLDGKASKYTRSRRPVQMVYSLGVESKKEALKMEARIKHMTRKEKLRIINSFAVGAHQSEEDNA